jgi:hypothetical protein
MSKVQTACGAGRVLLKTKAWSPRRKTLASIPDRSIRSMREVKSKTRSRDDPGLLS